MKWPNKTKGRDFSVGGNNEQIINQSSFHVDGSTSLTKGTLEGFVVEHGLDGRKRALETNVTQGVYGKGFRIKSSNHSRGSGMVERLDRGRYNIGRDYRGEGVCACTV